MSIGRFIRMGQEGTLDPAIIGPLLAAKLTQHGVHTTKQNIEEYLNSPDAHKRLAHAASYGWRERAPLFTPEQLNQILKR